MMVKKNVLPVTACGTFAALLALLGTSSSAHGASMEVGLGARQDHTVLVIDCAPLAAGVSAGLLNRHAIDNKNYPPADCLESQSSKQWAEYLGFNTSSGTASQVVEVALGVNSSGEKGDFQQGTVKSERRVLSSNVFKGRVLFTSGDHVSENLASSVAGLFDLLPDSGPEDPVLKSLSSEGQAEVAALPITYDFRNGECDNGCEPSPGSYSGGNFTSQGDALQYIMDHLLEKSSQFEFYFRASNGLTTTYQVQNKLVAVFVDDITKKCAEYIAAPSITKESVAKLNGLKPFLDFTSSNHWDVSSLPVTMMGSSAGLFEATGYCTRNKTMGVSASQMTYSLGFFQAVQQIEGNGHGQQLKMPANRDEKFVYNKSKVYVAHIQSDGDNLNQLSRIRDNAIDRVRACKEYKQKTGKRCAPRTMTLPGRTDIVDPALEFIYNMLGDSDSDGHDAFMLPPSGARYFYPSAAKDSFGVENQRKATLAAAKLLDMSTTIIWDLFYEKVVPKHQDYIKGFIGTGIEAVFFSTDPWLLTPHEKDPSIEIGYTSDYVLKDDTNKGIVVFNEWTRWSSAAQKKDNPDGKSYTPEQLAKVVAGAKKGSLIFIYDIVWGPSADDFQYYADLVQQGGDIILVDHRTLIDLGKQKHGL